ncbi:hypothetical protein FACS189437_09830 [Bacteroidia bacterium]|nr:hypothetical protein FACS189437_09830 [Bacteroidia bacterium]
MKMKKMMLLMLTLMILGAVSMNAQVRVGGTADPNPNALLDVNANNTTDNNTGGLALPRVSLTSTSTVAPVGSDWVRGMLVYNTNTAGDVTPGTYYCDGSRWVRVGTGTVTTDNKGIIQLGGDVTTASVENGTGATTATVARIQGRAVANTAPAENQVLKWNGSAWTPAADAGLTSFTEVDAIVGNEVTTATNATLVRAGSGTAAAPYTLARAAITGDVSVPAASNTATLAAITQAPTTSTAAPAQGGTFTAVGGVTVDTKGRVTGINTRTVTLPSANDGDAVIGNEVTNATNGTLVRAGSGTAAAPWTLARAAITGDVSVPAASNAATLAAVTQSNTTSTAAPAFGGTFTAIAGVTRDGKGRVTGVNTRTYTLPTPRFTGYGTKEFKMEADGAMTVTWAEVMANSLCKTTSDHLLAVAHTGSVGIVSVTGSSVTAGVTYTLVCYW